MSECPVTAVLSRWMRPISTPRAQRERDENYFPRAALRSSFLIIASLAAWRVDYYVSNLRLGILTLAARAAMEYACFSVGVGHQPGRERAANRSTKTIYPDEMCSLKTSLNAAHIPRLTV
jgi:hypothetical protein